jgi:hypothetical protein
MSFAKVSVPLVGTSFVQTPDVSLVRAAVHSALFFATFYFGFLRKART